MASTSSELPSPALEPGVSEAVAVPVVWSSPFVPFRSGGVSSILLDLLLIESASTFQRVMSANALKAVSQTNPAILDGVKHAVDDVGGRGNYTRTVVGEGGERLPVLASTHPVEEEVGVVGRRKRAACALETALEAVGFRVGVGMAERLATHTTSVQAPPLPTVYYTTHAQAPGVGPTTVAGGLAAGLGAPPAVGVAAGDPATSLNTFVRSDLDAVKFVCREVWLAIFGRQIDNLKTNHKGTFLLHDNTYRYLKLASAPALRPLPQWLSAGGGGGGGDGEEVDEAARRVVELSRMSKWILQFPRGLVRGVLTNLGYENVKVGVECPNGPPGIAIQVRIPHPAKAAKDKTQANSQRSVSQTQTQAPTEAAAEA